MTLGQHIQPATGIISSTSFRTCLCMLHTFFLLSLMNELRRTTKIGGKWHCSRFPKKIAPNIGN